MVNKLKKSKMMNKYYKIGISGHRDLDPSQKEENLLILTGHLLKLKRDYPNRELIILTPLADGADRLIVEAAKKLGIRYDVILPMPKQIYRTDFSPNSLKEFNSLIQNARSIKTIKLYAGNTLQLISKDSIYRDFQYRQVGRKVVELSDKIIIMSDGVKNSKIGGTEDIANYAKRYGTILFNIRCNRLRSKSNDKFRSSSIHNSAAT